MPDTKLTEKAPEREKTKKMRIIYFFAVLILASCNQKDNQSFTMSQATMSIASLKSAVINKGDTIAYYDLFNEYVDNNNESDFFYYSYIMAFKYNYAKAYTDIFFTLCKIYNVDTDSGKINLSKMDEESKTLSLECMKRASELYYLNSKNIYKSIFVQNKN
jgi:hypothetical protein